MNVFWTISQYDQHALDLPSNIHDAYQAVLPYVQDFLCAPHPYRKGAVCPFVPRAIKHDHMYFSYFSNFSNFSDKHIRQALIEAREFCLNAKKEHGQSAIFGALIILFPADFSIDELLALHFKYKPLFVETGLMLGAMYPSNQAKSLHHNDYFPLRTPTPTLVIRDIVADDLLFMHPSHYQIKRRIQFLHSFIETVSKQAHSSPIKAKCDEARQLLAQYSDENQSTIKKIKKLKNNFLLSIASIAGISTVLLIIAKIYAH
jgi:hypothetical protein